VARAWRGQERAPRLSVVVPVYNVADYLAEALDSILAQSYDDLEVVVVDDGSTDGSRARVDRYVERHPNVRLVASENRGLGAARNLGVRHCRGELLAFADSDDVVLPGAYQAMVDTLDETGSDFVVGAFERNFPDGTATPPRQRMLHRERRLGITIEDFPQILTDVFAWNKVFRRGFWEHAEVSFAEGVRYEDQPALTRAYLRAAAFDVIDRPVYFWRIRDDASSITQGKQQVEDLRDRFVTKRDALETVRRLGSADVLGTFYLDGLVVDLPGYFRQIPECGDDWWRVLHAELRDLWRDGPPFELTTIPLAHRLVAWLVVHDRRTEAAEVVRFARSHRPVELPVEDRGEHLVAKLPYWDDPSSGIPPELYRLNDRERAARLRPAEKSPAAQRSGRRR
jgi:glycosyltransferase involved in cell wall biosynthesis